MWSLHYKEETLKLALTHEYKRFDKNYTSRTQ